MTLDQITPRRRGRPRSDMLAALAIRNAHINVTGMWPERCSDHPESLSETLERRVKDTASVDAVGSTENTDERIGTDGHEFSR